MGLGRFNRIRIKSGYKRVVNSESKSSDSQASSDSEVVKVKPKTLRRTFRGKRRGGCSSCGRRRR